MFFWTLCGFVVIAFEYTFRNDIFLEEKRHLNEVALVGNDSDQDIVCNSYSLHRMSVLIKNDPYQPILSVMNLHLETLKIIIAGGCPASSMLNEI